MLIVVVPPHHTHTHTVAPEVSITNQAPMIQLPLNDTLSLTCNYVAVPTPTAEWFLNGSLLSVADPRISQTLSDVDSVLTLSGLTRDEGGDYSCVITNTRGSNSGNVTTLLILSECSGQYFLLFLSPVVSKESYFS